MPITIRPSERSCSVAYMLASTVGSRVPGFVTKCPSLIFSRKRACGGSGRTVTPKLSMEPPRGSAEHIAGARRRQRRAGGEYADDEEADPSVAGQRERQADERRARDDRERRPAVDEADGGP